MPYSFKFLLLLYKMKGLPESQVSNGFIVIHFILQFKVAEVNNRFLSCTELRYFSFLPLSLLVIGLTVSTTAKPTKPHTATKLFFELLTSQSYQIYTYFFAIHFICKKAIKKGTDHHHYYYIMNEQS